MVQPGVGEIIPVVIGKRFWHKENVRYLLAHLSYDPNVPVHFTEVITTGEAGGLIKP